MRESVLLFLLMVVLKVLPAQSFIDDQLAYERVREAQKYDSALRQLCEQQGLSYPPKKLYIRIFKFDQLLEVWGSNGGKYKKIKDYDVCQISGSLGPKWKQGDEQVPEGFYYLSQFNPSSNYYLSLKVSYPNNADRKRSDAHNLGGDIFIHGDCVTVGCVPIEDEPIKELYWLAAQVANSEKGNIPIHIFPFIMDELSVKYFRALNLFSKGHWHFWSQIRPAYDYFEKFHLLPQYKISESGHYAVKE